MNASRDARLAALLLKAIDFSEKVRANQVDRNTWEQTLCEISLELEEINSSWEELQDLLESHTQQLRESELVTA